MNRWFEAAMDWFWGRPSKARLVVVSRGVRYEIEGDSALIERSLRFLLARDERVTPLVQRETLVRAGFRPSKHKLALRLHAIDGEIATIYALNRRRLARGLIGRLIDPRRLRNIYVDDPTLARGLRGQEKTLWHALLSKATRLLPRVG